MNLSPPCHRLQPRALLLGLALLLSLPGQARAQKDDAYDAAVMLLRASLTVDRRNNFNNLLRSLRHLKDPKLKPLFKDLTFSDNRLMRTHAILGLAEIDPSGKIDLQLLSEIKDPAMQAELVGAAMDTELLDVSTAKQLLAWPGLDGDAKVVLAAHLVEKRQYDDAKLIKTLAEGGSPSRKGLCGLMLLQLNDPAGLDLLDAIDKSTDRNRDDVRAFLLQTMYRFKFDRAASWAARIAVEPGANENLTLSALRSAMRFGDKASSKLWTQRFNSTGDSADKMRYALSALNLAPWAEPALFDVLIANEDATLRQIGSTGKAVAQQRGIVDEVAKLLKVGHPIANAWALGYASHHADADVANGILTAIIKSYGDPADRNRAQRLDEIISAVQLLCEKDPKTASATIRPIIASPQTEKPYLQALLIGLIRASKGDPHEILAGLPALPDYNANGLRLLLLAKHGVPLSAQQLSDLGLLVRGGGAMPDPIRIQAGWAYLKQTKRVDEALAAALKR
jgi:hypothetical protein